jgi:hypothetical protein
MIDQILISHEILLIQVILKLVLMVLRCYVLLKKIIYNV